MQDYGEQRDGYYIAGTHPRRWSPHVLELGAARVRTIVTHGRENNAGPFFGFRGGPIMSGHDPGSEEDNYRSGY
jgi:hypothetical protein